MIAAAIAVKGRHPLLKHTIQRLTKNGIQVVCVGDESDKDICIRSGAVFETYPNNPLGQKWNRAFKIAKDLKPDAVLFVGSSDWVCDNWVKTLYPHLENSYMVGKLGCHLLDIGIRKRLVYWPGYKDGMRHPDFKRFDEPIGIGRLLSYQFLNKINWEPFHNHQDSSLDWTMYEKAKGRIKVSTDDVYSLAISTNRWENKHKFEEHWSGTLKSKKLPLEPFLNKFPEHNLI